MTEPTLKQWKRRALAAEEELEIVRGMRSFDAEREMNMARISRHKDLKLLLNVYYRESAQQIAARL